MNAWLTSLPLWAIFFAVGVGLLVLEINTLTFDLLWLALGALSGALVAWLLPTMPLWVSMLVAVGTGLLLLLVGRRWARRQRGVNRYQNLPDTLVGRIGEVMHPIQPPALGLVRTGTETWSATAAAPIGTGQQVRILSRTSTVVMVELV